MMVTRAYLMPYVDGMVKTAAYDINGGLSGVRRGVGDVNSDAQAALTAAGYTNVSCKPVTESSPLGTFTQNQCTTGQGTTITADNVAGMSQTQLQAQLAEEAPYQGVSQQQLNENIAALTGNAGAIAYAAAPIGTPSWQVPATGDVNPQTTPYALQQAAAQVPASSTSNPTTASGTPIFNITIPSGGNAAAASSLNLGPSTIISGVPDVVVYAGGALAALLLIGMMGGRH